MIIEIEGCDGVGKTTVAKKLAERIGAAYLKFPDRTTPTGQVIDVMLTEAMAHDPVVFQALNVVNRLEYARQLLFSQGAFQHAVCDRYEQSAYVYGEQDGLDPAWLRTIMHRVPLADLHVLLFMDPNLLDGQRLKGRDREVYEKRGVEGLRDQQRRFMEIWHAHIFNHEPGWVAFNAETCDADFIVNAVENLFRVAVL